MFFDKNFLEILSMCLVFIFLNILAFDTLLEKISERILLERRIREQTAKDLISSYDLGILMNERIEQGFRELEERARREAAENRG